MANGATRTIAYVVQRSPHGDDNLPSATTEAVCKPQKATKELFREQKDVQQSLGEVCTQQRKS
jgi:hypothetical protein